MIINDKIVELAEPFLKSIDAFIVEIKFVQSKKRKEIQLFIDTDDGITIEQCSEINRKLGTELEQSNIIEGPFVIQVSSPGLNKPLKLLRQFKKNIGRIFNVKYKQNETINNIVGTLQSIENEVITFIDKNNKKYEISFNDIIECKEKLPW